MRLHGWLIAALTFSAPMLLRGQEKINVAVEDIRGQLSGSNEDPSVKSKIASRAATLLGRSFPYWAWQAGAKSAAYEMKVHLQVEGHLEQSQIRLQLLSLSVPVERKSWKEMDLFEGRPGTTPKGERWLNVVETALDRLLERQSEEIVSRLMSIPVCREVLWKDNEFGVLGLLWKDDGSVPKPCPKYSRSVRQSLFWIDADEPGTGGIRVDSAATGCLEEFRPGYDAVVVRLSKVGSLPASQYAREKNLQKLIPRSVFWLGRGVVGPVAP